MVVNKKTLPEKESVLGDIFYRFLRNKTFLAVLKQLKSASDDANKEICLDKMREIMKYQQGFHKSKVILAMLELFAKDSFVELSILIETETKGL